VSPWDAWIGRAERREDRVSAPAVGRWLATFDREPAGGGMTPQGYHWCLGLPDAPTARLGPDGHPLRDDDPDSFLPPIPKPRRMWAASEVAFARPLRIGEAVERRLRIASIVEKSGASGALVFVDIDHETHGEQGLAVRETQSLVYRDPAPVAAPAPPSPRAVFDPSPWPAHRALVPSEALLFRYSALTFNSHRIHYDLAYAREVEGYRGLVVHGPLTATLLLDVARRELGDNALKSFQFRGVSPAICGETLHLGLRREAAGLALAAYAGDGREVMRASATL
jgi:3-methylfumaryl-CoA hydratase